ncbi:non-ribosomal peptide synthetase [Aspergillus lucknowensis]|uniref:Alpha/Beta hydrolase protein n=1 Tax=Aspergillus lucknowensis TaxID=176173 RepID=A0ABR4LZC5_9EURO
MVSSVAEAHRQSAGCLRNLSERLAWASTTSGGLIFYSRENDMLASTRVSSSELLADAGEKARVIGRIPGLSSDSILLLQFDTQREVIEWFWAATLAGYLPAISTSFVDDTTRRKTHPHAKLNQPVVLTSKRLIPEFLGLEGLKLHDVESLLSRAVKDGLIECSGFQKLEEDVAVLMLTSGSTGSAKAVPLRHGQLLTAIQGKSSHHGTLPGDIHLHALILGSDQVHTTASELLRDPLQFIRLLDTHKVRDSLRANPTFTADLSSLKAPISGGESNVVATCGELNRELRCRGVQGEVIRPGFGVTETCAGSIYSRACPSYDITRSLEFASLESCTPGMNMRIMSITEPEKPAGPGESGELQVAGPVDTIIVNGVKWSSTELEAAIEEEAVSGLVRSFTTVVPIRPPGSATEEIAVVYSPAYAPEDHHASFETAHAISKTVSLLTGTKPARLIPLPQFLLEKSSLGKIPHSKVRAALESGEYSSIERADQLLFARYRQSKWLPAETDSEKTVQKALVEFLQVPAESISMGDAIFRLGSKLQKMLDPTVDIPMSMILNNPTPGATARPIDLYRSHSAVYNAIVPLQQHKRGGTPLFCIHSGSGEVLVFIALAAHFPTRRVFALRTRGYGLNERFFGSIEEIVQTYATQIRQVQPHGPYAIAGYSLGSTLAFEVAKLLEAQGEEVKFLASIDYPPHIAHYVRDLNWTDVLLHIAFFLELIDEKTMVEVTPYLHTLDRQPALTHILNIGDAERATALAIDATHPALISDIAENFRVNVKTHKPQGKVQHLDVFVADPPTDAARDRKDWRENKLGRWADFCKTEVEFHDCPGIHAKMLNREHISGFEKVFKAATRRRGV